MNKTPVGNRSAFTLLEAVVTMGILAAISLVVLPSLLSGSSSADLNSVTQQIVSSAREAQSQSVDQTANTSWGIHFANPTGTTPSYAIFVGSSYASGTVKSTYTLPSNLSFVSSTLPLGSSADIVFSPISGVTSAQKTIEVEVASNPSFVSTITIGQTGQISETESWMGSGSGSSSAPLAQNIWVTDLYYNRVQEFNASGTYVSQFGSHGAGNGQFLGADGIAIDSSGNIWVTDSTEDVVKEFNASGTYVSEIAPLAGYHQLDTPTDVAIDSSGNIWVADTGGNQVEEFSSNGTYLSEFGSSGSGNGQFDNPSGIAIDSSGNIWVADTDNNRIEEFNASGTYLSKFGSSGSGNGQLSYPYDLAIDSSGNIWVDDSDNTRVEEFSSSGAYLSKFGSSGTGNGQIGFSKSIAIDSSGNIWVADDYDYRVEEFSSSGAYLSKFGSYGSGNGQFGAAYGIAIH